MTGLDSLIHSLYDSDSEQGWAGQGWHGSHGDTNRILNCQQNEFIMNETPQCEPVRNRRDEKAFLNLERELYLDDDCWVPPLWGVRREMVGFKPHPFYDQAYRQAFLVRRGNRVVGRLLAIVNHGITVVTRRKEVSSVFMSVRMTLTPVTSFFQRRRSGFEIGG